MNASCMVRVVVGLATSLALTGNMTSNMAGNVGARADEKPVAGTAVADTQLESVLVVFESAGKLVAMRVVKEHQIAVLQACFPDFHARPKSDAAVKWSPKYEIYFNFQDGRTIRVLVSGNSRYWTTGQGELEMRGMYFNGVIHELLKANMKAEDE